jgi:hypothetical protein
VALAIAITPDHTFCRRRVKDLTREVDFVPLYIESKCKTIHGWDLLETLLTPGDVLYLTIPASELDQLWRVTPSQLVAS